jgi:hypothetical protein
VASLLEHILKEFHHDVSLQASVDVLRFLESCLWHPEAWLIVSILKFSSTLRHLLSQKPVDTARDVEI